MAKFTFLELHLDDATITNNAPYSGGDPPVDDDEGETGGRSLLGPLVLGLVLVVAALVVWKAKGGADDDRQSDGLI